MQRNALPGLRTRAAATRLHIAGIGGIRTVSSETEAAFQIVLTASNARMHEFVCFTIGVQKNECLLGKFGRNPHKSAPCTSEVQGAWNYRAFGLALSKFSIAFGSIHCVLAAIVDQAMQC
jgi:hypothetical protein